MAKEAKTLMRFFRREGVVVVEWSVFVSAQHRQTDRQAGRQAGRQTDR